MLSLCLPLSFVAVYVAFCSYIVEDLMTIFIANDPKHNSTHGVLVAEKAL